MYFEWNRVLNNRYNKWAIIITLLSNFNSNLNNRLKKRNAFSLYRPAIYVCIETTEIMNTIEFCEKQSLFYLLFLVTCGLSVEASFLSLFSSQSDPPDPCYDELGMCWIFSRFSHKKLFKRLRNGFKRLNAYSLNK